VSVGNLIGRRTSKWTMRQRGPQEKNDCKEKPRRLEKSIAVRKRPPLEIAPEASRQQNRRKRTNRTVSKITERSIKKNESQRRMRKKKSIGRGRNPARESEPRTSPSSEDEGKQARQKNNGDIRPDALNNAIRSWGLGDRLALGENKRRRSGDEDRGIHRKRRRKKSPTGRRNPQGKRAPFGAFVRRAGNLRKNPSRRKQTSVSGCGP